MISDANTNNGTDLEIQNYTIKNASVIKTLFSKNDVNKPVFNLFALNGDDSIDFLEITVKDLIESDIGNQFFAIPDPNQKNIAVNAYQVLTVVEKTEGYIIFEITWGKTIDDVYYCPEYYKAFIN